MFDATGVLTSETCGTVNKELTVDVSDIEAFLGKIPATHANEWHSKKETGGGFCFVLRFLLLVLLLLLLPDFMLVKG